MQNNLKSEVNQFVTYKSIKKKKKKKNEPVIPSAILEAPSEDNYTILNRVWNSVTASSDLKSVSLLRSRLVLTYRQETPLT